jgi:hypothetical protein
MRKKTRLNFFNSLSDLRRRNIPTSSPSDFESLLRTQHEVQDETAEEMLQLTRALKEQSMAANEIIRKDIGTLEKTDDLAARNTERLGVEAERLAEHTKRGCRCWIWFIILLVSITFIGKDEMMPKELFKYLPSFLRKCSPCEEIFHLSRSIPGSTRHLIWLP